MQRTCPLPLDALLAETFVMPLGCEILVSPLCVGLSETRWMKNRKVRATTEHVGGGRGQTPEPCFPLSQREGGALIYVNGRSPCRILSSSQMVRAWGSDIKQAGHAVACVLPQEDQGQVRG